MENKRRRFAFLLFFVFLTFNLILTENVFSQRVNYFRFVVLGDSRPIYNFLPQSYPYLRMIEEINLIAPDFVINVGDLVFGYMTDEKEAVRQYEDFVKTMKRYLIPFYPVVGNHDIVAPKGEELYQKYIGKLYYSFNYGTSHFVIMDTDMGGDTGRIGEEQYKWLEDDLEKNKNADNIFVFMHKPMYKDETTDATCWGDLKERDKVHNLFKKYKVKMVFAGHEHIYRQLERDGIIYYITGGGGAEQEHPEQEGFYHYLLVGVKGKRVKVDVIEPLHLWVEYYPNNNGWNNKVNINLYCSQRSLLPLRIRGLQCKMPILYEGEEYRIQGGKIVKIEKNADNTNTLFISTFLRPPIGIKSITVEIKRK